MAKQILVVLFALVACAAGQAGSAIPVDPTSASVLEAVNCVTPALNAASNSLYASFPVQVVSGTQQIVSGVKYALTVSFRQSTCLKTLSAAQLTADQCPSSSDAVYLMDLSIWYQPWMTKKCSLLSFSMVNPLPDHVILGAVAPGMPTPIDPASPAVWSAVQCATPAVNAAENSPYASFPVQVIGGMQQVVSGMKYTLSVSFRRSTCLKSLPEANLTAALCPTPENTSYVVSLVVVSQPWTSPACSVLSVTTPEPAQPQPVVGSGTQVDPTSTAVWGAIECATPAINAADNSDYYSFPMQVISGTEQVVAGMKYSVIVAFRRSTCLKSQPAAQLTAALCPTPSNTSYILEVTVLSQAWATPACSLISVKSLDPVPQPATGGNKPVDPTSPFLLDAVQCATPAINAASNSLYAAFPVSIVSGTQQVVAGIKYTLSVMFRTSTCSKTLPAAELTADLCPAPATATPYMLKVVIVSQPWSDPQCELISVTSASATGAPASSDATTMATGTDSPVDPSTTPASEGTADPQSATDSPVGTGNDNGSMSAASSMSTSAKVNAVVWPVLFVVAAACIAVAVVVRRRMALRSVPITMTEPLLEPASGSSPV